MREDKQDEFPVSKLLRLKRYEQPPPEYFGEFLREFQQRQRSELLRRPAWRIALEQLADRLESLQSVFTASQLAYSAASCAVLLVAGMVTLDILQHPGGNRSAIALSEAPPARQELIGTQPSQAKDLASLPPEFTLNPQIRVPEPFQMQTAQPGATSLHPRYILDARPVSYEPPSSF